MQIVINISKEFERDWNETRFADCIQRVMCDLRDYPNHDKMTGNYEMETLEMLQNAFENGKQLPKGHGMERVEQLEAENKRLKEDLSRWQEGEWNNCEECCNRLAYKLAELRDGVEKVKAGIDNSRTISLTHNTALDECLSIINKYLGEVEHENEK